MLAIVSEPQFQPEILRRVTGMKIWGTTRLPCGLAVAWLSLLCPLRARTLRRLSALSGHRATTESTATSTH